MKTPDEIKKGLETCRTKKPCSRCPMWDECKAASSLKPLWDNALAYIQQLERERDALLADFKLYRERNITRTSGVFACDLCKHGGNYMEIDEINCPEGCDGMKHFQWRGVKEEKTNED